MSHLPGGVRDKSDDKEITVTSDQLLELIKDSLERQVEGISVKLCQEISTAAQFANKLTGRMKKQPKRLAEVKEEVSSFATHASEVENSAHEYQKRRPKAPLQLDEDYDMLASIEPIDEVSKGPKVRTPKEKKGFVTDSLLDDRALDWTRRAYVTDTYAKKDNVKRSELTWLGTPKWTKRRGSGAGLLPSSPKSPEKEPKSTMKTDMVLESFGATTITAPTARLGFDSTPTTPGGAEEDDVFPQEPQPDAKASVSKLRFLSKGSIMKSEPVAMEDLDNHSNPSVIELRRIESNFSLPDELFNRPLSAVVLSEAFDSIAGVMVLLGTIFIGIKTDYLLQNPHWFLVEFEVLEWIFCAFFVTEISMRLFVFRKLFFTVDGWEWNVLDLLLTVYQVLQKICEYVLWSQRYQLDVWWAVNRPTPLAMYLRFLRFLRLLRLVRVGRLQVYIVEFRVMASSVLCSVRYLIWACVILSLVIYVCAVHFSLLVGRHAVHHPNDLAPGTMLHIHWGTLPRSMFSLFQAITGGADWYNLLIPLMDVSIWSAGVFCFYVCFTYLYIMNIITGVFVETAMEEAQEISEGNIVNELRDLFSLEDDNSDGRLTWSEFEGHLEQKQMRRTFQALDLDVREAENLFTLLDMDGSGWVSYDEFVTGCLRLRGTAKSIDVGTLMYECRRTKLWVQAIHEHLVKIGEHLEIEADSPTAEPPVYGRSLKFNVIR